MTADAMSVNPRPAEWYIERLKESPFSLSRWGDGEWMSVLQIRAARARNTDGHRFFPQMGKRLKAILISDPKYALASRVSMPKRLMIGAQQIAAEHLPNRDWHSTNSFNKMWSDPPQLFELMKTSVDQKLAIVGPQKHVILRDMLGEGTQFIECPARDSFLSLGQLTEDVRRAIDDGSRVVWISIGLPAGILVDDVYQTHGNVASLLDVGSTFDMFSGRGSRSGYRKYLRQHKPEKLRSDYAKWVESQRS